VLEVGIGVPVTEVAERYGVSRQSVHTWLVRYRQEGIAGLEDRSHRVRNHPWRIAAEIEEAICELRRAHPAWGPRRLVFEMDRRGYGTVTRSAVYRTLVRNGLVEPKSRRRRRKDYRRWERGTAMELWQLDVTASAFLASGAEVKIVTGVDDHSRFCVSTRNWSRSLASISRSTHQARMGASSRDPAAASSTTGPTSRSSIRPALPPLPPASPRHCWPSALTICGMRQSPPG
jgi:transposase